MSDNPIRDDTAHIYCSVATRDRVRGLKRAGETYDVLLQKMADQYDPNAGRNQEESDGAV